MDIVNISFGCKLAMAKMLTRIMQQYVQMNIIIFASTLNYDENSVMGWNADVPGIPPNVISVGNISVTYTIMDSFCLRYSRRSDEIAYSLACDNAHSSSGFYPVVPVQPVNNEVACHLPTNIKGSVVVMLRMCHTGVYHQVISRYSRCNDYIQLTKSTTYMFITNTQD
jgi:hypothetical protein